MWEDEKVSNRFEVQTDFLGVKCCIVMIAVPEIQSRVGSAKSETLNPFPPYSNRKITLACKPSTILFSDRFWTF